MLCRKCELRDCERVDGLGGGGERERASERERERDFNEIIFLSRFCARKRRGRETDKQTDRQADRQTDNQRK